MDRKNVAARAAHSARAAFPFSLLMGLAPLGAFVLLLGLSMSMALWAAFAAAFTLGLKDFLDTGRIRPFDAVNVVLFALGALGAGFIPSTVTATAAVRLVVEGVLLAAMLYAFARGRPFTRQYAEDDRAQRHVRFSAAWTLALAVMSAADAASVFAGISEAISTVLGLVALAGALTFTLRYPAIAGGNR